MRYYTEEDIRKAFQAGMNKGAHQSYYDAPLDENEFVEELNESKDLGWNEDLEMIFKDQMDNYLQGFSDYCPTKEKVINEIEGEFNRLKLILNK